MHPEVTLFHVKKMLLSKQNSSYCLCKPYCRTIFFSPPSKGGLNEMHNLALSFENWNFVYFVRTQWDLGTVLNKQD